jgi:site-specific DNA-methyltransferase (adenine-specific)
MLEKNISKNFSEYPNNVLEFNISRDSRKSHPTQKPVPLLEYLIKTYTNENEVVLDNVMGSGSTGVACMNTKRKFIGIERDEYYYKIAEQRILRGDTTSIENIENIKLASSNRIEYDDIEW